MTDLSDLGARYSQQPFALGDLGRYNTALPQMDEFAFRKWLADNQVPFDPNNPNQDYDMRGFYQGLMQQNPRATSGINPNDNRTHYTDYWKTPSHASFSSGSKWAGPNAPNWINDSQLADPAGNVLVDEKFNKLLRGP
jgi:hypothetical protein